MNSYKISVKEWVEKTNAIGLQATAGRYGGTYAHKDIAFEFGMNAVLIHQRLEQPARLTQLNNIAISQMQSLLGNRMVKRLTSSRLLKGV